MVKSRLIVEPTDLFRNRILSEFIDAPGIYSPRTRFLCRKIADEQFGRVLIEGDGGEVLVAIEWAPRDQCEHIPDPPCPYAESHMLDSDVDDVLSVALNAIEAYDPSGSSLLVSTMKRNVRTGVNYDAVSGNYTGKVWRGLYVEVI